MKLMEFEIFLIIKCIDIQIVKSKDFTSLIYLVALLFRVSYLLDTLMFYIGKNGLIWSNLWKKFPKMDYEKNENKNCESQGMALYIQLTETALALMSFT